MTDHTPTLTATTSPPDPSAVASNGRTVGQLVSAKKKQYGGVRDGVTPYHATVDDRTFVFNRRPTARMQIQVMRRFVGRDDDQAVGAEDMDLLRDALASMLATPDDIDALMDAVDLEALTEILGDAMEAVTTRPTTASSGSTATPTQTTSATGSPAPASQPQISTG